MGSAGIASEAFAAIGGGLLVVVVFLSAVRTVVLPRGESVRLTRWFFGLSYTMFRLVARSPRPRRGPGSLGADYAWADRVMAMYAPVTLVLLPGVWAALLIVGFAGLFYATGVDGVGAAFELSGSSITTLGFRDVDRGVPFAISIGEALVGLGLVALLISYLPTMYSHFSRRESTVGLIEVRAGKPPTGVEMIMRYAAIGWLERLDDLWTEWERWFIEIAESHTSFPALVFFRSPDPQQSWVTTAGAVLDAAALSQAVLHEQPEARAGLCLRAGYLSLRSVSDYFGLPHDPDPSRGDQISVAREEFNEAYEKMAAAGIAVRADREAAWHDFAGWRVNYDEVLLRLCGLTMAPPNCPWSSDRALDLYGSPIIIGRWREAAATPSE